MNASREDKAGTGESLKDAVESFFEKYGLKRFGYVNWVVYTDIESYRGSVDDALAFAEQAADESGCGNPAIITHYWDWHCPGCSAGGYDDYLFYGEEDRDKRIASVEVEELRLKKDEHGSFTCLDCGSEVKVKEWEEVDEPCLTELSQAEFAQQVGDMLSIFGGFISLVDGLTTDDLARYASGGEFPSEVTLQIEGVKALAAWDGLAGVRIFDTNIDYGYISGFVCALVRESTQEIVIVMMDGSD